MKLKRLEALSLLTVLSLGLLDSSISFILPTQLESSTTNLSLTYNLIPGELDELDCSFLNTKYVDWLINEGFEESEIYVNGASNVDGWYEVVKAKAIGNVSRDTAIVHTGVYSARIEKSAGDNSNYVDLEYKWIRFNDMRRLTNRDEWFRINYWIYRTENVSLEPIISAYNASCTPPNYLGDIRVVPSDASFEGYNTAINLDTSLNEWVQKSTLLADKRGRLGTLLDPTGSDASGCSLVLKIKFRLRENSTVYLDDVEFRNYDAYGGIWSIEEGGFVRFTTDEPINHSSVVYVNPINHTLPLTFETTLNSHLSPALDSLVAFVVSYNRTLNDVVGFKYNASGRGKMDIFHASSVNLENCSFRYGIVGADLIEASSTYKIRVKISSSTVNVTIYDGSDLEMETFEYNVALTPKGVGFLVYVSANQTGYVDFLTLKSDGIRDVNTDAFTEVGLAFPRDYDWSSAPALRYHEGKYRLWYRQRENGQKGQGIGYAESPDLTTWTTHGQVFSNSTTKVNVKSFERSVINILPNGTYCMHYTMHSMGELDHKWEMGLATSQNGINWTDKGRLTYDGSYGWAKDYGVLYDDGYWYIYCAYKSTIYRSTNGVNFTSWKTDRYAQTLEVRKFGNDYYFYELDWSGTLYEAIRTTPDTSPTASWIWNNTYRLRDCNITETKPYISVEKVGDKWTIFYDLQYKWWFQPDPDSGWSVSNNIFVCKIFYATYPGTPPKGLSITIEDMEGSDNWVFAEEKYYEFEAKAEDLGIDFAEITVSFSDGADWINVTYDCIDTTWSIESGEELIFIKNGDVSLDGKVLTVTVYIYFRSTVPVALDVDLCLKVVDSENWQFGPWKAQENYFNIYNHARTVADAGSDQVVDEDTLVVLDGSNSSDNVCIINYTWSFMDVTPQMLIGVEPTYNFTTPGVYTITLNVTDVADNYDTDTVTITVLDITKPVANAGSDRTVNEDTSITLDGSASSDNVGITAYIWTFADVNAKHASAKLLYTFETPGVYTITLNVADAAGNWATETFIITVLDITKPVANAGQNQTVNVGEVATFDARATTDNVGIVSHEWDFGDEMNGTGVIAYYTYTEPGTYTVILTVRDATGNVDTDETIVTVVEKARTPSWIVGAVVAVLAAGIGATLVLWKRRGLRIHERG